MSQLMERQPRSIFSFPGLVDKSAKKEVVIEPIVEEKKEDVVVAKKKGGRPKKVVVEQDSLISSSRLPSGRADSHKENEAPKTTKKSLSLTGKIY